MIENTPELAAAATAAVTSPAAEAAADVGRYMPPDAVPIIGVMIPIFAIVLGIGIGMLALWLDYRKKKHIYELHHKERMAAIEKGMEVPPLPTQFFEDHRRRLRTPSDYLRRGLIWLLVGGALTAALSADGDRDGLWGLVPAAVGLAYLLFYFLDGRRKPDASADDARKN